MRKLIGLCAAVAMIASFAGIAQAQDESGPQWTFGFSSSYVYDFNDPNSKGLGSANSGAYASQEQDEAFNIDMVQLGVSGQRGRVGYAATVDYGDLAKLAGDSSDGDIALETAYLTYDADGIGAMLGRFGTPIGYEVLSPWGNAQIGRSWSWQAQPINHDGLTISGSADVVDVMIGVVNRYTVADQPIGVNDENDEKGIIASIGAGINDGLNIYVSGLYTEDRFGLGTSGTSNDIGQVNAIVSGMFTLGEESDIRYAVEGNFREVDSDGASGDQELWSAVGYLGTDCGPVAIDGRVEYLDDDDGQLFGINSNNVWSFTLTGAIALVEGVDLRVEYRHDEADKDTFGDGSSLDDSMDLIQAQVVWHPAL
jgi:hypothetical protein